MTAFGFTRKKFLSLTSQGRHRHTVAWLTQVFQTLRTGRVSGDHWLDFVSAYQVVTGWMDHPLHRPLPRDPDVPAQLAWVSDAIHSHRIAAGQVIRDHDLSATMITGDRAAPALPRPDMEYQVALDGLRSLFNIGSIYRICEAAGVETLILGNCPGSEEPRVRKTAMGAHQRMREEKTDDLASLLLEKKSLGFTIMAVETVEGSAPCHRIEWPQKAVLVFGNEEYGIAPHVLPLADRIIHIPMFGTKNSMNVATAVATVVFQAVFSLCARG